MTNALALTTVPYPDAAAPWQSTPSSPTPHALTPPTSMPRPPRARLATWPATRPTRDLPGCQLDLRPLNLTRPLALAPDAPHRVTLPLEPRPTSPYTLNPNPPPLSHG